MNRNSGMDVRSSTETGNAIDLRKNQSKLTDLSQHRSQQRSGLKDNSRIYSGTMTSPKGAQIIKLQSAI